MSVRLDGATRGDRAEAIALAAGGLALMAMPIVALFDRMDGTWVFLSSAAALAGLLIGGLGVRWFLVEGPPLASSLAELPVSEVVPELPIQVRLVDARHRLLAHGLRYVAFGGALFLVLFEPSFVPRSIRIAVLVGMFVTSVIADQFLLRPQRYTLDRDGLHPRGLVARHGVRWADVKTLYWRSYPGDQQPPYPSGERIIIECEDGSDTEFVFHRKNKGTDAHLVVQSTQPILKHRVRLLSPRTEPSEGTEQSTLLQDSLTEPATTPIAD